MDSRCRRRSRRPVFTATLEIERNLGTLLAFTRSDRRREALLRHAEEGSEIGAHGAPFGDRLLGRRAGGAGLEGTAGGTS